MSDTDDRAEAASPPYMHKQRIDLREAFASLGEECRRLHETCEKINDPQGFHGDKAARAHAVQLVDEAIKALNDQVEVIGRANAALAQFATD